MTSDVIKVATIFLVILFLGRILRPLLFWCLVHTSLRTHPQTHAQCMAAVPSHRFDEHKGVPTWLASRRKRCCPDVSVRHRFGRTSPNVRHFDAALQPMQIRKHDTNLLRLIVYRIDCRDTPRPITTSSYQNCTRQHK